MNAPAGQLVIMAPLSGVLVPLEQVPDPVFAQKMVGDGISLDPTSSEMLAPVAGRVSQLHEAHHALTVTTCEGVEVLVHIGVDTVMLKGVGFTPLVRVGDQVSQGQPVIRFDANKVGRAAVSMLTQIIITNGEKVTRMQHARGKVVAGKDTVLTLTLAGAESAIEVGVSASAAVFSPFVILPNPAGLHARPAAILAAEAKKFVADVRLVHGDEEANAKSVVAIMTLATRHGDTVRIKASGPDAPQAAIALARLITTGCGEKPSAAPVTVATPSVPTVATASANELAGVPASPGLAVGHVVHFRHTNIEINEVGGTAQQERIRFESAVRDARIQIDEIKTKLIDPGNAQILDAQLELLDDPEILNLAIAGISTGKSAAFAWRTAFCHHAEQLERVDNAFLRERAHDIRDVGNRVLTLLADVKRGPIILPANSVLIAESLSPSDIAALDRNKVTGFCTTTGGATGHVAILAQSLGIPAICGIDAAALKLVEGSQVILDGSKGILHTCVSEVKIAAARHRIQQLVKQRADEMREASALAVTSDGRRVEIVANVRNAQEARDSVTNGGEGIGLLRSEFLFDGRETPPSEDEQAAAYTAVAEALGSKRPLVIRTLDVGGDKPLRYLPMPREDNPFLGLRGIRVSLDHPNLFRTQLRAILRVAPLSNLHILFPMITAIDEFRAAKAILAEEMAATGRAAKVGVMIEVPSAAILADVLAREADFFSIGTNDLTQYTLAMDRGHPRFAKLADALHPAVLRLIAMAIEGAHRHGKWVGVCGGMASDSLAVPILIGLGVDELSVSVPAIPSIKALVKRLSHAKCKALAAEVLQMGTAEDVRARLATFAS